MNRLSFCGSRLAALCAALVFLLGATNGAAQQLNPGSDVFCGWRDAQTKAEACFRTPWFASGNSVNAVPGLRAAHIEPSPLNSIVGAGEQDPQAPPTLARKDRGAPNSIGQFAKNIVRDQAGMWTSPLRIRRHDLVWLIPFAGATAAAIATDARAVRDIDPDATYVKATRRFTLTGAPYTLLGASGATYLIARATHNDRLKETGALGTEAIADSILVVTALKLATNRERPNEGSGEGEFWPHGTRGYPSGTSFPSGHAAASWALARVVAGEYPHRPVKIVGYTLASLVSMARVTGRKHYPSDALVGSVFGYLIGDYVVRHRASEREHGASLTIAPFSDARTHTRGISISFSPQLFRSGRMPN